MGAWSLLWGHSKSTCCGSSLLYHLLRSIGLNDLHRSLPTLIPRFYERPLLPPASALHLPAAAQRVCEGKVAADGAPWRAPPHRPSRTTPRPPPAPGLGTPTRHLPRSHRPKAARSRRGEPRSSPRSTLTPPNLSGLARRPARAAQPRALHSARHGRAIALSGAGRGRPPGGAGLCSGTALRRPGTACPRPPPEGRARGARPRAAASCGTLPSELLRAARWRCVSPASWRQVRGGRGGDGQAARAPLPQPGALRAPRLNLSHYPAALPAGQEGGTGGVCKSRPP